MLKNPVEIHIYDDDGNAQKSFKLCIIPWKFMKKTTSIFSEIGDDEESVLDAMTSFLCEVFKNQFTEEELDEHGDAVEVVAAVSAIMEEVAKTNPNAVAGLKMAPQNAILSGGAE